MLKSLIVALGLVAAGPALAQHAHGAQKGPNGGPMEDVAGVHVEMVVAREAVTFNLLDEAGKPLGAAGFTGSAMVAAGTERKTLPLAAAGEALAGKAAAPVPKGAAVTLLIKTPGGKSGQAKFTAP
ncbi:hypothetical protein [Xanthobacter sp. 91]|uniref:hypothetical protein n=1 Tax=Xanthobacter sp. 91 TaxID=1117244 RepID=UPI00049597A0|nr:hypothetical protein [Xanthobacter sp. 91]